MIKIPIEIGDIVRVGKFKNKRIKVKTIEYDEYGLPLINGRPLLTMRIEKLIDKDTQAEMKKEVLRNMIREEISKVLSEADLSIKQKINRFTKEVKALGATDFYIKPVITGSDKYLRKFWVNTSYDAKDLAAVRKWIMSHPEATKNAGIGAENYSYVDKQNKLSYSTYFANDGYHYLSIEPLK